MNTKKIAISGLFLLVAALLLGSQAGATATIKAQLTGKDIKGKTVWLELRWLDQAPPKGLKPVEKIAVRFQADAKGCLDLKQSGNLKKAAALALSPGDILAIKLQTGPKGLEAKEVYFVASDRALDFPGRSKTPSGLAAEMLATGSMQPVIVTLKTDASGQKLQKLVDSLLKKIPAGEFKLTKRFKTLPMVAGEVSLRGLTALAASPLVEAIEADEKATIQPNQEKPSGKVTP